MPKQRIRIRLKAFDHKILDQSAQQIVETAEKKPISSDAIAGTYYFRRGRDFAEAAKRVILKDARVHDRFFLSSSFNEMILMGKKLVAHRIDPREPDGRGLRACNGEENGRRNGYRPHKVLTAFDYAWHP